MKTVLRALVLLALALPLLAVVAVFLAVQDTRRVPAGAPPGPADIERVRQFLSATDLRLPGTGLRTAVLDEPDLARLLDQVAWRLARGAFRVSLQPGVASLQASVELPVNPFGRYLNVDAAVRETGDLPRFEHLMLGRLPIPAWLADAVLREGLHRVVATGQGAFAAGVIEHVAIGRGRLSVSFRWDDEIAQRARSVLVAAPQQERLRAYQTRLAATVAGAASPVSLGQLLPPLFRLASERGADGDIAAENRAAIVILAFYVLGKDTAAISTGAWPQAAPRRVTLAGRDDFPKHFLVSAAVAAEAGSALADAIGLYKEIDDSKVGSGFSFNDIAADRAGTRFGELAVQSQARAHALSQAVAAGVKESDFMPYVADLPEFMPQSELLRRFGGVDGAGYRRMMASIESRIAALRLLR